MRHALIKEAINPINIGHSRGRGEAGRLPFIYELLRLVKSEPIDPPLTCWNSMLTFYHGSEPLFVIWATLIVMLH